MRALALLAVLAGVAWWSVRRDRAGAAADDSPPGALAVVADQARELVNVFGGGMSGGSWQLPAAGESYRELIAKAEQRYALPENLVARLLYQESRFRPEIISGALLSPTGAAGIAQLMPPTAAELGVDPLDPAQAIPAAAKMLRRLYDKFGSWTLALAAYNWGEGNVARKGIGQAPAETLAYVSEISADVGVA